MRCSTARLDHFSSVAPTASGLAGRARRMEEIYPAYLPEPWGAHTWGSAAFAARDNQGNL